MKRYLLSEEWKEVILSSMVPLFDGPFENHLPDVPERDREHAVTHIVTIVTICVNKAFDI